MWIQTKIILRSHLLILNLLVFIFLFSPTLLATPFPVKGEIYDSNDIRIGTAAVYPKFVEILDNQGKIIGRVGVMVDKGLARLFLAGEDAKKSLVGYGNAGTLYNDKDQIIGSYFWTPTWSFIYNKQGKRAGKVKCIAWPRVCAAGVAGFLLHLYQDKNAKSP